MNKKVLVIVAHPDDEVLGCGGTIARLVREGASVAVAILGEGLTARFPERREAPPAAIKKLQASSRKALARLGVVRSDYGSLPDNRFDTVALLDITKSVESLIRKHKPQVIYTTHGGDLNIDHATVHRAVMTATRPMAGTTVREVYAFEVPSSTEWAFGRLEQPFRPNVFVDITRTLKTKLAAMKLYEGETRKFPHPRSSQALTATARRWGSVAGMEAAEAFEAVRLLR